MQSFIYSAYFFLHSPDWQESALNIEKKRYSGVRENSGSLARTFLGPKRRSCRNRGTTNPTLPEWIVHMGKPAKGGGLSAVPVPVGPSDRPPPTGHNPVWTDNEGNPSS